MGYLVKQNRDNVAPITGYKRHLQTRQKSSEKLKYLLIASVAILVSTLANSASGFRTFGNSTLKPRTRTYIIIIDAGSTGSRINLFTLHNSAVLGGQLVLDDTLYYETEPGLSSFVDSPADVRKSLNVLLDIAKGKIPRSQWSSTSISLKATAGMRLLPQNLAQNILDECKRVFASSGFEVNEDSVTIMDGAYEGIYSWFTTNFLLDRFGESKNTVVTIDLGGASNQVTFSTSPDDIDPHSPYAKNVHRVNAFDRNISVFTESFLGLGLMAARKEILTHGYANTKDAKVVRLTAPCMPATAIGVEWKYAGVDYIIKGKMGGREHKKPLYSSKCTGLIRTIVKSAIPRGLPSLQEQEIYASSHYFELMKKAGLIDATTGGVVSVGSIYKLASKACYHPNAAEPFMCLDLSFIYVLLHDGFGLERWTKISMRKYIDGIQSNWALGAAFDLLQSNHSILVTR